MSSTQYEVESLDNVLAGVNVSKPSPTKFLGLDKHLASVARLQPNQVVSVTISKPGNFSVRSVQSSRAQAARLLVGVVLVESDLEAVKEAAIADVRSGRHPAVLLLHKDEVGAWTAGWGVASQSAPEGVVENVSRGLGTHWHQVIARATEQVRHTPQGGLSLPTVVPTRDLVLDPRIRRMLRTSVAARPAVMLVGPPGTGKSQLIEELLRDVAEDPSLVGMISAHEANVVTPDESWSVRELVGGDTVDDAGRIRFAPGAVLDAVTQDRWLVLDEANRADMDRIFGGLLTWLAGQQVTIGRTSGDPDSGPVHLGWTKSGTCEVDGLERLRSDVPGGDPVSFLAGTEWRLLGTYNALDAQRVFRFGLALGRRFAHVPVPAPDAEAFAIALQPFLGQVLEAERETVGSAITEIYSAHQSVQSASIGPAAFLGMPAYVAQGLVLGGDRGEVMAEAYLTALGTWLSRLEDDQVDQLGPVLGRQEVLGSEWEWVRTQLSALR